MSDLQELIRQINEFKKAIEALSVHGTVHFDPSDPASVQTAIANMESMIDTKAAPYMNNPLIPQIVKEAKDHFRKEISNVG